MQKRCSRLDVGLSRSKKTHISQNTMGSDSSTLAFWLRVLTKKSYNGSSTLPKYFQNYFHSATSSFRPHIFLLRFSTKTVGKEAKVHRIITRYHDVASMETLIVIGVVVIVVVVGGGGDDDKRVWKACICHNFIYNLSFFFSENTCAFAYFKYFSFFFSVFCYFWYFVSGK